MHLLDQVGYIVQFLPMIFIVLAFPFFHCVFYSSFVVGTFSPILFAVAIDSIKKVP